MHREYLLLADFHYFSLFITLAKENKGRRLFCLRSLTLNFYVLVCILSCLVYNKMMMMMMMMMMMFVCLSACYQLYQKLLNRSS